MPSVYVPRPDLGRHQPLALEHTDGIAAEPHEDDADEMVSLHRRQERRHVDVPVFTLMLEPERRPHDDRLAVELEADRSTAVDAPPGRPLERPEALANVLSYDVAGRHGRDCAAQIEDSQTNLWQRELPGKILGPYHVQRTKVGAALTPTTQRKEALCRN
jgi:hypothetical protein